MRLRLVDWMKNAGGLQKKINYVKALLNSEAHSSTAIGFEV
ncbi:hypothetical protein [Peribacillus simplex]|nr:hypothetical protein [Peribacillus simplex]